MGVFVAYFDVGGSYEDPKSRVLSFAGYISTEAKWRKFEREWQAMLDRENVRLLHMKDFAHSTGEFEAWKGDEERRSRFLGGLAKLIKRHTNREFTMSILLEGYRALDKSYLLTEDVGSIYVVGAWLCINQVREFLQKRHNSSPCLYIFEKGDANQGKLIDFLRDSDVDLGVDPIFMDKEWINDDGVRCRSAALQAADFLAYEQHKNFTDMLTKGRSKVRNSLFALADVSGIEAVHAGRDHGRHWNVQGVLFFEGLVKMRRIKHRPGGPPYVRPDETKGIREALGPKFHGSGPV